MRLRFFLLLLTLGVAARAAVPVYKNDTLTLLPLYLMRSNFTDSATLTWTVDGDGRMTPNVIGGASSNAQPPSANLTNWSTVSTQALRVAKTVFLRTNGVDATAAREWMHLPFRTFSNAVAAMTIGDNLDIGPGTFFGNTTVTLLAGTSIVGAGPDVTTIHIDANVLFTDGVRVTNNCYLADFTMLSTNVTGTYMIPFRVSNATNVLFRNVKIDAYYDGIIGDGGNSSMTLDRVDIHTGYDCINIASWNTNSLFEVFGCNFIADATKGPTPAADSRAIYSVLSRIRAYGSTFETRNLSTATTLEIIPDAAFPPEFYGCRIKSDIGETVIDNWQCQLDLDSGSPTFLQCTNYTWAAWKFVACELDGKMSIGPYSGIYGGYPYRRYNLGAENFFTNAVRNSFVIGNSNYIGEATNLAAIGFTLTNRTTGTLELGVTDASKSTWSATKSDHRVPVNVAATVGATNVIVTNLIRNIPRTAAFDGTNVFIDGRLANFWNLTLTNNVKLHATNIQAGATYVINMRQDGTGSRLLYVASLNIQTNAASSHVLSTAANALDVLYWTADDTGTNVSSLLNANFQK